MTIPNQFPAFRIHSGDAGYRAGIEFISVMTSTLARW